MNVELPIGIFDSGVGGLTVLKAITRLLPAENLLYLGDTARVPYGTKSAQTIIRYTLMTAQKLAERGVKMLVIACNTATSAALPEIAAHFAPMPVLGVIRPSAKAAVAVTGKGHIAVIGTEATIHGQAYQTAIATLAPQIRVTAKACTLLVPLAEEGWISGDAAQAVLRRYLDDIFSVPTADKPDTLLLGCTHFPLFQNVIQELIGNDVIIVDSATATAKAVRDELCRRGLQNDKTQRGKHKFMTTDNVNRFAATGGNFLGYALTPAEVELVDL